MNLEAYGDITSVVVSRGGEIVVEEYLEGDAATLHNTRSCTKTVAGMLLGIAIGRGLVPGIETPLAEVLGEPAPPLGQTSTAGGLLLASRSLLSLGELYLRGGDGLVPPAWVAESIRAHARIDDATEYGYLWWLKSYAGQRSFYMTGTGGNRVHVFPDLELVAVIITTNFRRRDAHALSDSLVVEEILEAR